MSHEASHARCAIFEPSATLSVHCNTMLVAEYKVTVTESASQADTRSVCVITTFQLT